MYRKLMFLISFVALLGLVSVASAETINWDGGGADNSFCTPENWVGDVVPGPDDQARSDGGVPEPNSPNDPGKDILVDCDVECGSGWRLPAYEGKSNQNMDMVSGNVVVQHWRAIYEGDCTATATISSGTLTVTDGGSSTRLTDDGGDNTFAHYIFGGNAILDLGGHIRSGDNGGNVFITVTDDCIINGATYMRIGDDGGGTFTASGNASITLGESLFFPTRAKPVAVDISGNVEIFTTQDFQLGQGDKPGSKGVTTCDMTMSGGTINCRNFECGWGINKDDGSASLTMTGGLIVCRTGLRVGGSAGSAEVHLDGGEVQVLGDGGVEIADKGSIDITGGALILAGNKAAEIANLVCVDGSITGYGSPQGIVIDYGVTNPGKTTVVAEEGGDVCQAYCPVPADGADKVQSVITPVELCWEPGLCIGKRGRHGVYFDGDYEAVRDANDNPNIPPGRGFQRASLTCYNVTEDFGPLPLWTTYYWRIDEHNEDGSYTKGKVWSFTTGCEDILGDINKDCLLNFEDYASIAGTWQQEQLWP